MLPAQAQEALDLLTRALGLQRSLRADFQARWRATAPGGTVDPNPVPIDPELELALAELDRTLPGLTRSQNGLAYLTAALAAPEGEVLLIWCVASASRRDARIGRWLTAVAADKGVTRDIIPAARARVVEGPLLDALACVPLLGTGDQYALAENAEAFARLEILVWEAGASAMAVPELGAWIWGSHETFEAMIGGPAHGSLRRRVIAARFLEVSARGMPKMTDPSLVGRTLQTLQPLLLHPEPLVWVHAARALGRLTGTVVELEATLRDWVRGDSPLLRQRALTAFASLPAERLKFLGSELSLILDSIEEAWALAPIAAATPYLYVEARDLRNRLAARIFDGEGGAIAARALARGLATLFRRGVRESGIEAPLQKLRELARRARPDSVDDTRRWLEVISVTDPIDGAERDPLDVELGVENLVRLAAQYDDEEADARAARFADTLAQTFQEARRIALGTGTMRHRAAAMNAFEGCARSLALSLWEPLLATRPGGNPVEVPDLRETWAAIAKTPAELLDVVRERRAAGEEAVGDVQLEVLALRLGGYALDACDEDGAFGVARGPTAQETCLWLKKLDGLVEGEREMPPGLSTALSSLFWRLVDTTRGTALGEVDDIAWLGPFAAWWAVVIDRPAVLVELATALPMMSEKKLQTCCDQADVIRTALSAGEADGAWNPVVEEALRALHAEQTELAAALSGLAYGLRDFATAAGPKPDLEAMCHELRPRRRTSPRRARRSGAWSRWIGGRRARSGTRLAPTKPHRERAARRHHGRACHSRTRALDARHLVHRARPRRIVARRERRPARRASNAAAATLGEEERAEGHRRLRARETARRRRHRHRVARSETGRRSALRPQDPEGRCACRCERCRARGHPRVVRRRGESPRGDLSPERRQHHRSRRLGGDSVPRPRAPDRRRSEAVRDGATDDIVRAQASRARVVRRPGGAP